MTEARPFERALAAIALAPLVVLLARVLLTADFWTSVWLETTEFASGVAAVRQLTELEPAWLFAVLTILTQAVGTVLVVTTRRWAWLGAGMLGAFTLIAAVLGHAPWSAPEGQETETLHSFMEHLGLIGGFVLVGYWSLLPVRDARAP